MTSLAPIVEGQSEVESVPLLLRRIQDQIKAFQVQIAKPFRIKRNKVVKAGELEKAITMVLRTRENVGGIMVLIDADDDCPVELSRNLLQRCQQTPTLLSVVVVANRELESWFLGSKEALKGIRGIRSDALSPPHPESIRGAKEELSRNMERGNRYIEVDDQPAFAQHMDFETARKHCPSFDKFVREASRLFAALGNSSP